MPLWEARKAIYIYNSLNDFIADAPSCIFRLYYSLIPGEAKVFSADLKLGQLGIYIQDEFNINRNFKLTYGIRGDLPTYLKHLLKILRSLLYSSLIKTEILTGFSTGKWPKAKMLLSPRVGFRWRVPDEPTLLCVVVQEVLTGKYLLYF